MTGRWKIWALAMVVLAMASPAEAVPHLQIYIPGATYDSSTETWVIESLEYDLYVVGANDNIYDVKVAFAAGVDENGSISVTWNQGTVDWNGYLDNGVSVTREPGSTDILQEGTDGINLTADPYRFVSNGTPVMGDDSSVPPHGVFPTSFYEYYIGNFGISDNVTNYIPGSESGDTAQGELKIFHVKVEGYSWVDIVAYDHVVKTNDKIHSYFSPFSHDGGSGDGSPPQAIPEPATLLLLGTGLAGTGALLRKRRKK